MLLGLSTFGCLHQLNKVGGLSLFACPLCERHDILYGLLLEQMLAHKFKKLVLLLCDGRHSRFGPFTHEIAGGGAKLRGLRSVGVAPGWGSAAEAVEVVLGLFEGGLHQFRVSLTVEKLVIVDDCLVQA
jgi:hypothetical protein